jgi:hypothetical protein
MKELTSIEKEMKAVILENLPYGRSGSFDPISEKVASVAKKWIEKALSDAFNQAHYSNLHPDTFKRMEYNEWAMNWLKSNGII